jgi:hypothetical protein
MNSTFLSECSELVVSATSLLYDRADEWTSRYSEYARQLLKNKERIQNKKNNFKEWPPVHLYMDISSAKRGMEFSLRYQGQNIAKMKVNAQDEVTIITKKFDETNKRDFGCHIELYNDPWASKKASEFRQHFKGMPVRSHRSRKGNEEHRMESLLLTEFSKASQSKLLRNIRPVKIADFARFQMPTPFSASSTLGYSGANGGGIDILSRIGIGAGARLCIMEVKDENTSKEPLHKAVQQGLAYAVFIRELLRSKSGSGWWQIFGFNRRLPEKLELSVVSAMPPKEGDDLSFAGQVIHVPNSEDCIHLHYLSFQEKDNKLLAMASSLPQCTSQES